MSVLEDFAAVRPKDVLRRGDEIFVTADAVADLLAEASRRGVRLLGLEGFLISDDGTYPAFGRIADFAGESVEGAARKAGDLLAGAWVTAPAPTDQMNAAARGRHMLSVTLAE